MWADFKALCGADIKSLFDGTGRASEFSIPFDGMLFDYSKTSLTIEARQAMLDLAVEQGVEARRDAMFAGEKINDTERRAVLHIALRALSSPSIMFEGENVLEGVRAGLTKMEGFARDLRSGRFQGAGGPITDVVNIGIGGSHLGPEMVVKALLPYRYGPRCHFVSNADAADIHDKLEGLDPTRTLVIVASKSFTTVETMTNAETARTWMAQAVEDPASQFVALASAEDKTEAFGIAPERVFGFEDWVGGRYSIWGPIGLSLMLSVGPERFREFLVGGEAMDQHFVHAPLGQNMPVMLALVGLWHHQVCGYPTRAVLPYDQRLARLPAYFQQLEMESNGKGVTMDGTPVKGGSGPVVWGEPGTNGQHAFYQLIHQGTQIVPCEFMVAAEGHEPELTHQHELLVANCLAQSEALMLGRTPETARRLMKAKGFEGDELERQIKHRIFKGNRPSTTLIYDKLTPRRLGQIIALYEHRVFVEGVILGINSFDQWGVELGKVLAVELEPVLQGKVDSSTKDGSTRQLVDYVRSHWRD